MTPMASGGSRDRKPGRGAKAGHRAIARRGAKRGAEGHQPAPSLHRLTDLAQIKVLADPLRMRILELLGEERTTKQVAGILGQPPTRLYHHMAALERVGLVRLARTRQSRGAVEKYYVAVAKAFSGELRLSSSPAAAKAIEATHGIAVQVLENTAADLRALLESGESPATLEAAGVISFLEVRGSAKELKSIRDRLMKILKECTDSRGEPIPASPGYRLTIAYFPLANEKRST
jgi:DNA-binding transcriptional ArsR family regulator